MNAMAKNVCEALELVDVTEAARFYGINARAALLTPRAFEELRLDAHPGRGLVCLHDLMLSCAEAISADAWAGLPECDWRMPLPAPVPAEVAWRMGDRSPLRGQAFVARRRFGGCLLVDLADDDVQAMRLAA